MVFIRLFALGLLFHEFLNLRDSGPNLFYTLFRADIWIIPDTKTSFASSMFF